MVLFVQNLGLEQLPSNLENHRRHNHRHHPPEANSASLQALFHNLFSKLENHHNHHHQSEEALSASLQVFQCDVSNYINQLSTDSKPESEFLSLICIHRFLEILPLINKSFAKLLVEIEYPMGKWEASSIDEYLNYTLNFLELLNSISSSLSRLSQARLSLSHALTLVDESPSFAIERFLEFQSKRSNTDYKVPQTKTSKERDILYSDEERIIHLALADMKKIGSWVCGFVLSSLSSDAMPYMEMRKPGNGVLDSSLIALDIRVSKVVREKQGKLKEFREINEALNCLVSAMANEECDGEAKELKRRLEVLEKGLMDLKKKGDCLFSEVLATRNELLERFRSKSN